jgi:hypothetical protein
LPFKRNLQRYAVWKKFGLTRKPRSREARILVDKDGKAVVGLYKLTSVDPQLESTRFQPLNL